MRIADLFRAAAKAPFVTIGFGYFIIGALLIRLIPAAFGRRARLTHHCQISSRILLRLLGIRVSFRASMPFSRFGTARNSETALVVMNHLSYIDILILASIHPTAFVTSVETGDIPFLGWLCRLGDVVFVERRNRNKKTEERAEITARLRQGQSVAVFPEATSTNGETVLPFKQGIFGCAIAAQVPVRLYCLRYTHIGEVPVSSDQRDLYCWYGSMAFLPHFMRLLSLPSIYCQLSHLGDLAVDRGSDRQLLALAAEHRIRVHYLEEAARPWVSPHTGAGHRSAAAVAQETPANVWALDSFQPRIPRGPAKTANYIL